MNRGLLDWVTAPSERELRFLRDDGSWPRHDYAELAAATRAVAAQLLDLGLERGERVVVLHRTGPNFVASFFGVLLAGGTASPLAPPIALGSGNDWTEDAARVIQAAGARFVLADEDLTAAAQTAAQATEGAGQVARVLVPALDRVGLAEPMPRAELALLQFTSGSRGPSRGVRVSWENLEANLGMIHRWVGEGQTGGASWLPLYHDMGLVGGLLVPVVYQMGQGLLTPEQFITTPLRWLAEFGERAGEIMVMPNFGFDYVVRRIPPEKIAHMDFSSVKVVITGAERIRPASLAAFAKLLGPRGFRVEALQPAYGLAEATLAVTGVGLGQVPWATAIACGPVEIGQPVAITHRGLLTGFTEEDGELWHISCGRPLDGTDVEIVDDLGEVLPEGHLGEIAVTGPAVAQGYTSEDRDASTRFEGRRLFTGDAGFLDGGELFVLGRIGDSLQVRGRNVYVEDIEHALSEEGLFAWHRMAAVAGYLDDAPTVCLLTEAGGRDVQRVVQLIAAQVGTGVAVRVLRVPRKTIELTSSGKPRRRRMWQRILSGALTGDLLAAIDLAGVPQTVLPGSGEAK